MQLSCINYHNPVWSNHLYDDTGDPEYRKKGGWADDEDADGDVRDLYGV